MGSFLIFQYLLNVINFLYAIFSFYFFYCFFRCKLLIKFLYSNSSTNISFSIDIMAYALNLYFDIIYRILSILICKYFFMSYQL